jgi:hypothetical protein
MEISSDEARELCFAVGERLGFDAISCDRLIAIVGNPFSALKYLVAAGEGRKLATLQQNGLLQLPDTTGDAIEIPDMGKRPRRMGSKGIIFEKKRRRPPKKK